MRVRFLVVAGMFALSMAAYAEQPASTVKGYVSEEQCGASHSSPSAEATKCVKKCIRGGSAPVLVSEGKVYKLKGEDTAVQNLAGKNVTVKGTVNGETITVLWVSARKS